MNEQTDQQLLRDYIERRSEPAFAELVRRHVDLVHSAALRMVRDPQLAQDVTQGAFIALAQNAPHLREHPVLSGWLHRTARNLAGKAVRSDVRRRAREQEAVVMNELLSAEPNVPWEHIAPHLDAALDDLGETDRDALLLRYFERKSAREIAQTLGTSEEAAQKRVNRAVERLRELFAKRGVTIAAGGLVILITANAVQGAPVGLAATICTAAVLTGTTTATITATKVIAMTTLQKAAVTITLAAAIGAGIYEAQQATTLRNQNQLLQQQQTALQAQAEQAGRERATSEKQLAALGNELSAARSNSADLLRLRGENTRLRNDSAQNPPLKNGSNDVDLSEAVSWKGRVALLKQRLEQNPDAAIPELRLATERDWLNAAMGDLKTDDDYRRALSQLRSAAQNKFISNLQPALQKYTQAHNGVFPTDLSQLEPLFESPVDPAILARWQIVPAGTIGSLSMGGDYIITQRSTPDPDIDSRMGVGPYGYGSSGNFVEKPNPADVLTPALVSYAQANNGQAPTDPSQLLPFISTDSEREQLDIITQRFKGMTDKDKAQMQKEVEKVIATHTAKK